ncbi:MAG: T9SS type A sorting domain-containing protein [Paludibacter sp.]
MKNTKIIAALLFCLLSTPIWSQVEMGKWRTHFAYNNASQIAQSENKIFAVSEGALFSVDKTDEVIEFYSKLSGLNGSNISNIEYDTTNKLLIIIYANGNIDVMDAGGVSNIPDLYNKQMSASKAVNQIQFYQGKAYLSCNFGIVVLNMQKKEVADTYYIGDNASEVKVLNTTVHNGTVYALTASKIYNASISETSLVNYQYWSTTTNLPGSGDFQSIASFDTQLILLRGGKLYKQDSNNNWSALLPTVSVTNFTVSNGSLNVFSGNKVYLVDNLLNTIEVPDIGTLSDAEYDVKNNTYWFAANAQGVASYKAGAIPKYYKPAGPAVNSPWDMTFAGKKLFVVPGGRWSAPYNTPGVVMIYENGVWSNIYGSTIHAQTNFDVLDFMNTAVDPLDNKHFFVTAYGNGLFEFKNNEFFKWHNTTNSTIKSVFSNDPKYSGNPAVINSYMRLDGAIFDKQGDLFLVNCEVAVGLKFLTAAGKWEQLIYPELQNMSTLGKILISNQNQNQKWVLSVRGGQIIVFDDNGTLVDQTDDKSISFTSFPDPDNVGSLLSHQANYSIAQDKNGVIWVGTEQGPYIFQNPSKAFEKGFTASRIKIPRNDGTNLADYLLVNEKIKSIAIDGANRKWLGTESSGAYLMSENGQETIKHFTVSNSPLLSNDILSIAINPVSGEVFFGTGQGIVSYQSDAANANATFGDVFAFPNPVRENYKGIISITGLVENTQVKITDLNGNLICQTVSNGSIATWDGKDVHGRKVSTGVYFAICASADGTQSTITKIMVIN